MSDDKPGSSGPDEQAPRRREADDGVSEESGTEDEDEDSVDEQGAAHAVTPATTPRPSRPPRRTGVFVDPEELRDHVGDLLRAILGGHEVDAFGNFTFTHEGARVFVTVGPSPVGPHVGVFSVTNLDLDLDIDLARFLLTANHSLGFGAFSYDKHNRAVWLRHTLLGTTLDLPELHSAVAAVASTAASLGGQIRERFGGRAFQDVPDDVRNRMEPPETSTSSTLPNTGGYL